MSAAVISLQKRISILTDDLESFGAPFNRSCSVDGCCYPKEGLGLPGLQRKKGKREMLGAASGEESQLD